MKAHFTIIGCLFGTILQLSAQGHIVPNGVTFLGFNGLGYEVHVLQNPTNLNYTGFMLEPTGKTPPTVFTNTFLFNPFLDEQVRTFLVSSNQPINLQTILANIYPELTYPNNYVFTNAAIFYLAFYTGEHFPSGGIYEDPLFGWGKFINNQGTIQMLDSALEYGGEGILAGTPTIIPEPSVVSLIVSGGLLLGLQNRTRKV